MATTTHLDRAVTYSLMVYALTSPINLIKYQESVLDSAHPFENSD
jgi:hypothetical protein